MPLLNMAQYTFANVSHNKDFVPQMTVAFGALTISWITHRRQNQV